jgi:hypothetical protein
MAPMTGLRDSPRAASWADDAVALQDLDRPVGNAVRQQVLALLGAVSQQRARSVGIDVDVVSMRKHGGSP